MINFVGFLVPEVIIGVPKYNCNDCITYIYHKLEDNGFNIKYTHPNLLFISWKHWIPQYVRSEIKKKTGVIVDGYGNKIDKGDKGDNNDHDPNEKLIFTNQKYPLKNLSLTINKLIHISQQEVLFIIIRF